MCCRHRRWSRHRTRHQPRHGQGRRQRRGHRPQPRAAGRSRGVDRGGRRQGGVDRRRHLLHGAHQCCGGQGRRSLRLHRLLGEQRRQRRSLRHRTAARCDRGILGSRGRSQSEVGVFRRAGRRTPDDPRRFDHQHLLARRLTAFTHGGLLRRGQGRAGEHHRHHGRGVGTQEHPRQRRGARTDPHRTR